MPGTGSSADYSQEAEINKFADRSKDGWLVVQDKRECSFSFVQAYESEVLASNSEDEKRLKKAKNAAEKKRENPERSKLGSS